jgi:hypothetical protein
LAAEAASSVFAAAARAVFVAGAVALSVFCRALEAAEAAAVFLVVSLSESVMGSALPFDCVANTFRHPLFPSTSTAVKEA